MTGVRQSRRAFLSTAAVAGAGVATTGRASAAGGEDGTSEDGEDVKRACDRRRSSREHVTALDGTDHEFDIYVIDSGTEGSTAFVTGGIHGDEEAGYRAANNVTNWRPNAGRLVVVPEANPTAIRRGSRYYEGGNLNREFDAGGAPSSELARAIWYVVEQADPDVLIDLEESRGIYHGQPPGVGQAVFHSPTEVASEVAQLGIDRVNRGISSDRLKFKSGGISPPSRAPSGLLAEKATYDAGIPSMIVETYEGVDLQQRVEWQETIVGAALDYFSLY